MSAVISASVLEKTEASFMESFDDFMFVALCADEISFRHT
jgi:hypothetical protein